MQTLCNIAWAVSCPNIEMEVYFGIRTWQSSSKSARWAELDAYPSILRSKNGDCFLMVHVDDLLIVGSRDAVMKQLVPSLKYAISIDLMSKPGDDVTFLKRTHA